MKFVLSKSLLLIASLVLSFQFGFCQITSVVGKVVDAKTLEPLPLANVFINNTTIGTSSDNDGNFKLTGLSPGVIEIVFSYVGYQTYQLKIVIKQNEVNTLSINLVQSEQQLKGVEVTSTRDKAWEKQVRRFEKLFLGTNKYASSCKILNPWVLEFYEKGNVFTAKANGPLEIDNMALGYKQHYYLKSFTANSTNYSIIGNSQFEAMLTRDSVTAKKWDAARNEAYRGSLRHLFKALLSRTSEKEGFLLYFNPHEGLNSNRQSVFSLNKDLVNFKTDSIVFPGKQEGEFRLLMKIKIEVHYTRKYADSKTYEDLTWPVGWIETTGNMIEVNNEGVILNPGMIVTSGYFNEARIADQLPLNYDPLENSSLLDSGVEQTRPTEPSDLKAVSLQERVYLHTNKSSYYKGEMLWFKGYMQYNSPRLRDSLSRVLYVDLFDSQRAWKYSAKFFIDSGFVAGNIPISDSLEEGQYLLRAYTNWMLNYGPDHYFVKLINVLTIGKQLKVDNSNTIVDNPRIAIKPNKEIYSTREKVTLNLLVTDYNQEPIQANLSVSVVEVNQEQSSSQKSILSAFKSPFPKLPEKQTFKNNIEYGLTLEGSLTTAKGKAEQTTLTVIQGQFADIVSVKTDLDGKFEAKGFNFFDSTKFSFQAKRTNQKSPSKVILKPQPVPPLEGNFNLPKMNFDPSSTIQQIQKPVNGSNFNTGTKLLNEVTVTATKIENVKTNGIHGISSVTITSKDIIKYGLGSTILDLVQSKAPSMLFGTMRGVNSFYGSSGPLILVNNVIIDHFTTLQELSRYLSLNDIERIDILKDSEATIYGARGSGGVIAIYTKTASYAGGNELSGSKSLQEFTLMGYNRPIKFYSPDYEKPNGNEQDFRSTIFWAPVLKSNEKGEASASFFTSDLKTRYQITVEGMDKKGNAVFQQAYITVN